jgi:hypothetical protein
MYISFDYKCRTCSFLEPRLVRKDEKDSQVCKCGSEMIRLPPATRTTFRFADTKLKE